MTRSVKRGDNMQVFSETASEFIFVVGAVVCGAVELYSITLRDLSNILSTSININVLNLSQYNTVIQFNCSKIHSLPNKHFTV